MKRFKAFTSTLILFSLKIWIYDQTLLSFDPLKMYLWTSLIINRYAWRSTMLSWFCSCLLWLFNIYKIYVWPKSMHQYTVDGCNLSASTWPTNAKTLNLSIQVFATLICVGCISLLVLSFSFHLINILLDHRLWFQLIHERNTYCYGWVFDQLVRNKVPTVVIYVQFLHNLYELKYLSKIDILRTLFSGFYIHSQWRIYLYGTALNVHYYISRKS